MISYDQATALLAADLQAPSIFADLTRPVELYWFDVPYTPATVIREFVGSPLDATTIEQVA